jgi:Hypothetical protein (DUF2513)
MTARYGVQGALNETGHGSELLLRLESLPLNAGEAYNCGPEDKEIAIEGYSPDEVEYYLALLWEIGFIDCPGPQPLVGITFLGLTWSGEDYLDTVRNPASRSIGAASLCEPRRALL